MDAPSAQDRPDRRQFLARATCALGACAGACALGPAVVAILSPLDGGIVTVGSGKLDLGPLSGFTEGAARKVVVRAARTDAFLREPERALGSVIVVRGGDAVRVLSAACPPAGCDVA